MWSRAHAPAMLLPCLRIATELPPHLLFLQVKLIHIGSVIQGWAQEGECSWTRNNTHKVTLKDFQSDGGLLGRLRAVCEEEEAEDARKRESLGSRYRAIPGTKLMMAQTLGCAYGTAGQAKVRVMGWVQVHGVVHDCVHAASFS